MDDSTVDSKLPLIPILSEELEFEKDAKGIWSASAEVLKKAADIAPEALAARLHDLCVGLTYALSRIDVVGAYRLDSVEVQVDVTAKGELRLIGSAGSEIRGGLKLSFKKADHRDGSSNLGGMQQV